MESQFEEPQVHSINVSGGLRKVEFAGQTVITGFFKTPVSGKVHAHQLGLEGDAQGDLRVHGGPDKAVYFYPQEHYQDWEELLGTGPLSPGSFGENITSRGLLETDLSVGDVIRIGTVIMQVLQPRSPCYKLQMKFDRPDMVALFMRQNQPGWYASVLQEGTLTKSDAIEIVSRAPERISIADIWHYSLKAELDEKTRRQVSGLDLLPAFWKERIIRT
jgi:MOSC domain-containing protein YiiM